MSIPQSKPNYIEKYRFIRDDLFIYPFVNSANGKSMLILKKIDIETREIEFQIKVVCIHSAIVDIYPSDYHELDQSILRQEKFNKEILKIRSSEQLVEIDLNPEEKFKAMKSWAKGIAEAGIEAFKIQSDIERFAHLMYPLANKLLRFKVMADRNFLPMFLQKIERECQFEGV